MSGISPSLAKNFIRRALRAVLDTEPSGEELEQLWDHFHARRIYCDADLDRTRHEGRIDHAISESQGGPHHISNLVLACATCNDVEKREANWEDFLRIKVADTSLREVRGNRITEWITRHRGPHLRLGADLREAIEREVRPGH